LIVPRTLSIKRTKVSGSHALSITSRTFGGDWAGSPMTIIDLMKALSKIEVSDPRTLVNRLPAQA